MNPYLPTLQSTQVSYVFLPFDDKDKVTRKITDWPAARWLPFRLLRHTQQSCRTKLLQKLEKVLSEACATQTVL